MLNPSTGNFKEGLAEAESAVDRCINGSDSNNDDQKKAECSVWPE